MGYVILDTDHLTAIESIDRQHAELADAINNLRDAALAGAQRSEIDALLARLIRLTRLHFSDEEALFDSHDYPDAERHAAEHRRLLGQLDGIRTRFEADVLQVNTHLIALLKAWLLEHVRYADRAFSLYSIAQRGDPSS